MVRGESGGARGSATHRAGWWVGRGAGAWRTKEKELLACVVAPAGRQTVYPGLSWGRCLGCTRGTMWPFSHHHLHHRAKSPGCPYPVPWAWGSPSAGLSQALSLGTTVQAPPRLCAHCPCVCTLARHHGPRHVSDVVGPEARGAAQPGAAPREPPPPAPPAVASGACPFHTSTSDQTRC